MYLPVLGGASPVDGPSDGWGVGRGQNRSNARSEPYRADCRPGGRRTFEPLEAGLFAVRHHQPAAYRRGSRDARRTVAKASRSRQGRWRGADSSVAVVNAYPPVVQRRPLEPAMRASEDFLLECGVAAVRRATEPNTEATTRGGRSTFVGGPRAAPPGSRIVAPVRVPRMARGQGMTGTV